MGSSGKHTILTRILFFLNIIACIPLLLAYLASEVSPQTVWLFALFGLMYPYLLIINLVFIVWWALKRKFFIIYPLFAIAIGWGYPGKYVQFNKPSGQETGTGDIRITTWNVQNLARNNVYLDNPVIRREIFNFFEDNNPDVLCMQEFMSRREYPEELLDSLSIVAGLPYYRYVTYHEQSGQRIDALAVFSRYPIVHHGILKRDISHNYTIYTDILINEDTIRIFNVHLESIRLGQKDYEFLTDMDLKNSDDNTIQESMSEVLRKLKKAYQIRAIQARKLAASKEASPFPVIICGDFNDTPSSYAYSRIRGELNDAFIMSGRGFGNTYSGKLPSNRIDFILYDDHYVSRDYETFRIGLSDHFPITCLLHRE